MCLQESEKYACVASDLLKSLHLYSSVMIEMIEMLKPCRDAWGCLEIGGLVIISNCAGITLSLSTFIF